MPIRLAIFEDVTVVRDMLVEVFRADPAYELVSAHADGAEGLASVLLDLPDVAIVDYVLPGLDGLSIARKLIATGTTKVVLLTAHDGPEVLLEATKAGVHGLVTKGSPLGILKEAVHEVVRSGTYHCPQAARVIRSGSHDPLTARERDILARIASGKSNKQVAYDLGLSEKTVANHRTNLMKKIGVHDVVALTRYALERGLVPPRGKE